MDTLFIETLVSASSSDATPVYYARDASDLRKVVDSLVSEQKLALQGTVNLCGAGQALSLYRGVHAWCVPGNNYSVSPVTSS